MYEDAQNWFPGGLAGKKGHVQPGGGTSGVKDV